ncbi:MAG: hypothetical protein MK106_05115 [Mariniblastus sp.]|nr:hypothetical protein [Mariniblastus sp.]
MRSLIQDEAAGVIFGLGSLALSSPHCPSVDNQKTIPYLLPLPLEASYW